MLSILTAEAFHPLVSTKTVPSPLYYKDDAVTDENDPRRSKEQLTTNKNKAQNNNNHNNNRRATITKISNLEELKLFLEYDSNRLTAIK
jgi:hypothetical protein